MIWQLSEAVQLYGCLRGHCEEIPSYWLIDLRGLPRAFDLAMTVYNSGYDGAVKER
jgi:hypothetical protein